MYEEFTFNGVILSMGVGLRGLRQSLLVYVGSG